MAPEKVTEMVLNVDLKCSGCYKKVKKVICKIPQIRDQVFDVEKNKVKVMVVCCNPEKIRDKLCYKGGGAIQSIEIVEKSEKPKEPEKTKAADQKQLPPDAAKPPPAKPPAKAPDAAKPPADKPKEPEKAKPATEKPKDAGKPKEPEKAKPADKPKEAEKQKPADKPKDSGKPPEAEKAKPKDAEKPKEADKPSPPKDAPKKADPGPGPGPSPDVAKMVYEPVQGYPQMYPPAAYPLVGYGQYYDQGYGGAPYQHGYGMTVVPPPPPPSYGGFGYEYGYNGNRSHYNTSNDYRGEEEGEGCRIM